MRYALLHISIPHIVVVALIAFFLFSWLIVKGGNKYDEPENE